MKPKRKRTSGTGSSGHTPAEKTIHQGARLTRRKASANATKQNRRQWAFRILAVVLAPLLALAIFELVLKIAGFGYPTSFLIEDRIQGQQVLVENPRYTWRFMPKVLARSPQPIRIQPKKAPDTYRIFIFGESAAMGDPEPTHGFARVLEVLLKARYTNQNFEVINTAMTAINSHVILPVARDCARREGDFWVLYMGHNEVLGPFGAGTVFGAETPSRAFIKANLLIKSTRTGQLLDEAIRKLIPPPQQTFAWEGMEMFLDQQVRLGDPRLSEIYQHFERNLAEIARLGKRSGAKVIISTTASNLKDSAPFGSLHKAGLAEPDRKRWQELYDQGDQLQATGKFAEAAETFLKAEAIDDQHAALQFQLARCERATGRLDDARRRFQLARDLDTLRFRSDTRLNEIVRQVAQGREAEGICYVDAAQEFGKQSGHGIAGSELFYEHVHLEFEGNFLLARIVADEISKRLPSSAHATSGEWLTLQDCARRLAVTGWSRFWAAESIYRRINRPPFLNQLNHAEQVQQLRKQLGELYQYTVSPGVERQVEACQRALELSPHDWMLRAQLGRLREAIGDYKGAAEEWRHVVKTLPHFAVAQYQLGSLLNRGETRKEAIQHLQEALRLRPDLPEAWNSMGIAKAHEGKFDEAYRHFEKATELRTGFAEARVNWGITLASQGRGGEALIQYRAALTQDSNNITAHLNTGKLYMEQGEAGKAVQHFRAVLRLNPTNQLAQRYLEQAEGSGKSAD